MIFAYADPPYPGMAHFYPEQTEVDHVELVGRLMREYPDGWALSTASTTLEHVIDCCRANGLSQKDADYRIGSWVKPFASFKKGVGVAFAWEPVIFAGGRRRTPEQATVRDWVAVNITIQRGLVGCKPQRFCEWVLDVLNVEPGDDLHDLYPGTGGMTTAFKRRIGLHEIPTGALFPASATSGASAHPGAATNETEG